MSLIAINEVSGVGNKLAYLFRQNGVWNTYDLIQTLPKKYDTYTLTSINKTLDNQIVTAKLVIKQSATIITKNNKTIISFSAIDDNQNMYKIFIFNQGFLINNLKENAEIIVKGKLDFVSKRIVANKIFTSDKNLDEIVTTYNLPYIKDGKLRQIIRNVFEDNKITIYENLPINIIKKYELQDRLLAFKSIHFPKSIDEYNNALKRFKYEEAFFFNKSMNETINVTTKRASKNYDIAKVKQLVDSIPFSLSNDQKTAVNDIFKDYKKQQTNYRLIQGDVGSGKTVVALIAAYGIITAKEQVALMAPTEVLAKQHYHYFKNMLDDCSVILLTSDTKEKDTLKQQLKEGKINVIIGTHALAEADVEFKNLGLIIIDEQHKFGVKTRNELSKKGNSADLLYLTATPIPRTLAITFFNNTSISNIREKPVNRKTIITTIINDEDLTVVYEKITNTINKNEKVYIVVPAINSTHAKHNIENVFEKINEIFNNCNVYSLHGKMNANEQNTIISKFLTDNTAAILIATTMIEVGIDVKNATLMIIYAADFFGLSQLHQLRGRVGRSELQSECVLVTDKVDVERLNILKETNDGFILSEEDLKLRGPGALLGHEQSGQLKFKVLDFNNDFEIINEVKTDLNKNQSKI